jgi:hypothetical protein
MRASHIKTFRGHGSFISSNLVGETHVPRNAPGTPQANARFRPARAHARSADESQESGGDCAQRPGSGRSRSEAGLGQKQGGSASEKRLRERAASGSGEARAWGRAREGLGREQGGGLGEIVRSPTSKTHRWPPDGQAAHAGLCRFRGRNPRPPGEPTMRSGRPRRRRKNAGADPLGHRSFMESA